LPERFGQSFYRVALTEDFGNVHVMGTGREQVEVAFDVREAVGYVVNDFLQGGGFVEIIVQGIWQFVDRDAK
jgi:hypothetical protein